MVVSVVFKDNLAGKTYSYLADDFEVKPMDKVLVPVGNYGHVEVATVVAVWVNEVDHVFGSVPSFDLKRVIAPADLFKILVMEAKEMDEVRQKYDKLISKIN